MIYTMPVELWYKCRSLKPHSTDDHHDYKTTDDWIASEYNLHCIDNSQQYECTEENLVIFLLKVDG